MKNEGGMHLNFGLFTKPLSGGSGASRQFQVFSIGYPTSTCQDRRPRIPSTWEDWTGAAGRLKPLKPLKPLQPPPIPQGHKPHNQKVLEKNRRRRAEVAGKTRQEIVEETAGEKARAARSTILHLVFSWMAHNCLLVKTQDWPHNKGPFYP